MGNSELGPTRPGPGREMEGQAEAVKRSMIMRLPDPVWFKPAPTAQHASGDGQATPVSD